MRLIKTFTLSLCITAFAGIGTAEPPIAPSPRLVEDPSVPKSTILEGWHHAPRSLQQTAFEWVPIDTYWADQGARIFHTTERTIDLKNAAIRAGETYGLQQLEVVAFQPIEAAYRSDAVDRSAAVMLKGTRSGKASSLLAWVWWHDWNNYQPGPSADVFAFMAENKAFDALGGYRLLATAFHDMSYQDFNAPHSSDLSALQQVGYLAANANAWFRYHQAIERDLELYQFPWIAFVEGTR